MADIFKYTLTGKEQFVAAYDPKRFDANLRRRMRFATELNGKVTERFQRQLIQNSSGKLIKNAPLTIAIKHSSKPLVHTGEMFQSIRTVIIDDFTSFTGVPRGGKDFDIVELVTSGGLIPVTMAMRAMFFALWKVSIGEMDQSKLTGRAAELYKANRDMEGFKPISDNTHFIRIPPRPWHERAARSAEYKGIIRENWRRAIQATFRDMVSK